MTKSALTPLENALLNAFHHRYQSEGFPPASSFTVDRRVNTGAGRYTYLLHTGQLDQFNGQLDLGRFSQINMSNLKCGASFWLQVKASKIDYLEIMVNGDQYWDGSEGVWEICDPDTGAFSAAF